MEEGLTALYVWRNTVSLGYPCLESVLSTIDAVDHAVFCVDPTSDADTLKLVDALCEKYPKARRIDFEWPIDPKGDGSRIGIATRYGFANCPPGYVLNVQADEVYPEELTKWIKDSWRKLARVGVEGIRFKILHTEFNAQQYQGGNSTSSWETQSGAGYTQAMRLVKKCPAIRPSHDAWSFDGVGSFIHCDVSDRHPVIHLHDFFRDSYIALRRNAADSIWTNQSKFGNYAESARVVESTREQWENDPKWTKTDSMFDRWLNPIVKPLLGKTKYEVRWELTQ